MQGPKMSPSENAVAPLLLHAGRSRDEDVPQPGECSISSPFPPKRGGPCIAGRTAGAPRPRPAGSDLVLYRSRNSLNNTLVLVTMDPGGARGALPRPTGTKSSKLINYKNHQKTKQKRLSLRPCFCVYSALKINDGEFCKVV